MAIKKSDLYASLWASCDELRGGMDASQYKDYVLFMLFIKYISDKYGNSDDFAPPVVIPKGASFKDMVALKGKATIGEKINTQVIQPLIEANNRLARSDFPDFNDPNKLGEGSAMVERLSNLIGIFQKPELDFSGNRAENDDILGDAYEYLMRHFATESGKSKGQFYTPSEVSRIIAKVLGAGPKLTETCRFEIAGPMIWFSWQRHAVFAKKTLCRFKKTLLGFRRKKMNGEEHTFSDQPFQCSFGSVPAASSISK